MRNIDRIRAMDAEQLAGFLAESGAPVPTEFCDILCAEDCMICPFVGPNGDKKAWQTYLESEYGGEEKEDDQEPQESDCPLNYDQMACDVTGTRWWSDTMVLMNFDSDKERLPDCPLIEVALGTDTDVGAMEVTCENCMHCTGTAGNEHCFNCAHYYEDNFIPRRE